MKRTWKYPDRSKKPAKAWDTFMVFDAPLPLVRFQFDDDEFEGWTFVDGRLWPPAPKEALRLRSLGDAWQYVTQHYAKKEAQAPKPTALKTLAAVLSRDPKEHIPVIQILVEALVKGYQVELRVSIPEECAKAYALEA